VILFEQIVKSVNLMQIYGGINLFQDLYQYYARLNIVLAKRRNLKKILLLEVIKY